MKRLSIFRPLPIAALVAMTLILIATTLILTPTQAEDDSGGVVSALGPIKDALSLQLRREAERVGVETNSDMVMASTRSVVVAAVTVEGFEGLSVGVYRESDLLLPIILRAPEPDRSNVASLKNLQIWSPVAARFIPLRQVVSDFEAVFEDPIIYRRDRRRTLTVFADPKSGSATVLFDRLRPQVEALSYPPGYRVEWGGEYEDSAKAQSGLAAGLPTFLGLMVLVVIALFNSLRQPLIIWLTVPLALIGVTAGLLATSQPFGFMALLGFLSLSGMLIKNAVVLIDEINLQNSEGKEPLAAIVDSGASRLRPVAMAAATTALGMIPLLLDGFFVAMAVTIIAGLLFATVLTMVVVPVLYATFYRVPSETETR